MGKLNLNLISVYGFLTYLSLPESWIIITIFSCGSFGLLIMTNHMIHLYNQVDSIPTYITSFILLNIFAIAYIMDDISLYHPGEFFVVAISGGVAVAGIWLIIKKPMGSSLAEAEVEEPGVCTQVGGKPDPECRCLKVRYCLAQVANLGLVGTEDKEQIKQCLQATNRVL